MDGINAGSVKWSTKNLALGFHLLLNFMDAILVFGLTELSP